MSVFTWIGNEAHAVWTALSAEEQALVSYFGPLFTQIETTALAVGKQDFQAGLQVLTDGVTTAVAAGAAAAASGGNAVTAAETTFVSTVSSEGITAVHNSIAGLIKAGVAIAQTAAADLASATGTTPPAAPVAPATPAA